MWLQRVKQLSVFQSMQVLFSAPGDKDASEHMQSALPATLMGSQESGILDSPE